MTTAIATNRPKGILFDHDPSLNRESFANYRVPTIDQLRNLKPKVKGTRWNPVPHIEWIDQIRNGAAATNHEIVEECYSTDPTGHNVCALFRMGDAAESPDSMAPVFGARWSNIQDYAGTILCGGEIFICSNGIANGEIVLARKQTTNIQVELGGLLIEAFARWQEGQRTLLEQIEFMKQRMLMDGDVTRILGRACGLDQQATKPLMSAAFARRIRAEYEAPRHEVFAERNAWSLYNSSTEMVKHERGASNTTARNLQMGMMRLCAGDPSLN